jgi:uncharacterized protein YlaI
MKICEICKAHKARHDHHIQSKSKGGSSQPFNIAYICPNCHDDVHRGIVILEGKFLATGSGYTLIYHMIGEESITGITPDVYIFGECSEKMNNKNHELNC